MGMCVIVLGRSAAGKSTSLRNFGEDEVIVLNVMGKPLPFRGRLPRVDNATYGNIETMLKKNDYNCYVIDDAGYLMSLENFTRAHERGYDKFVEMAEHFKNIIDLARKTSPDTIVYIMMHIDQDADGYMKPKTIGKMLDEKFCIEGAVTICLHAFVDDKGHHFAVNNFPNSPAKSSMDMFETDIIDNDLKLVDSAIREYYGLPKAGIKEVKQ